MNGTNELSELLLARIALLMDQSRALLPLWSAKARGFGELWRENVHTRIGTLQLNWPVSVLFGQLDRKNEKRPKFAMAGKSGL